MAKWLSTLRGPKLLENAHLPLHTVTLNKICDRVFVYVGALFFMVAVMVLVASHNGEVSPPPVCTNLAYICSPLPNAEGRPLALDAAITPSHRTALVVNWPSHRCSIGKSWLDVSHQRSASHPDRGFNV